ncbi:MAG: cell division protein ZapA [Saprospiraceae bacterium]|nr:cell division protein ZapA [Saprospiraceae bacterium]MCB0624373.1 cell division protein ZapA [Saprospiraceae bacterium]MCB0675862.1 cell division protein ZapA [Saprospiraceae bacterium]MCB0681119.1 cell division protein ZapA [Saprospiraceae bacterium]
MAEQDSKQLTVLIANRPYPLKINASDESEIRKIVKEVNERINQFQLTYPNRDKQDCLALAILAFAVDLHRTRQTTFQQDKLADKLSKLDDLLGQLAQ